MLGCVMSLPCLSARGRRSSLLKLSAGLGGVQHQHFHARTTALCGSVYHNCLPVLQVQELTVSADMICFLSRYPESCCSSSSSIALGRTNMWQTVRNQQEHTPRRNSHKKYTCNLLFQHTQACIPYFIGIHDQLHPFREH